MRQFHSDFYFFFNFFGSNFFLNGFPNPFTAHSMPSFLFDLKFHFSLVVFLFTCGILTLIFCFFFIFWSDYLKNGFLNSLIVHSRSSCFSVLSMKILWIVRQDLSCYVFLLRRHDFCYDHMTSQPLFVHSFMQFQLSCMRDVIFRS